MRTRSVLLMAAACVVTLTAAAVTAEAVPVREVLQRSHFFLADEFPSERLADSPRPRPSTPEPEPEPPVESRPSEPAPAPEPSETQAEAPKPQPPASQAPAQQSPVPTAPTPAPTTPVPAPQTPPQQDPTPAPQPPTQTPAPAPAKPVYRLPGDAMEVAITFDDGPSAYTEAIAALLKKEQVPAAFFWLAGNKRLDLAAQLLAQGHQVGTHTVTHVRLTGLDFAGQQSELARSQKILQDAAKSEIRFFRPPYGAYNPDTLKAAQALGLQVILWNVDSRDWDLAAHPEQIVPGVMKQVKPGSIILLHERAQTLQVLPDLIKALRDAGYSIKPLP